MSQPAEVLSFSHKFLYYTDPSLPATHPDVIKSYQTAIDSLNEKLKVLSEQKNLDQGFNICHQRSELFDEVLKDIFERTKNYAPPEGPVLLGARGGYGRSELTFSSDVDTCVIEDTSNEQDNTAFLKGFISNIKSIGHTIPELHDTPIVNSVHELMTLPLLIGNEKNGENVIDIKKFLAMQDFRPLSGNFEIADRPIERLKNLAFENRAQLVLYHIHEVRDRWTKQGEQAHHLDNFNIKNGFGGLRDLHFGLYAIAYQTKRSVAELTAQLLPAEKEAYNLLLHVREWMAHKRPELKGVKRDDARHLSFAHDLVPRFEYLFGRDTSGKGPINKLISAREVAARFSDRVFARVLQDGVKVSPNTNLKGLSSRDPSLGVVVAPDARRINQSEILMELVIAATREQLPIIGDAVTLELICEVGDRIKPDSKILEVFGSSKSPIDALKFLYQRGLLDKLVPVLKSLSSTFYPEEHRLTTENMLDRALTRIENLRDLYGEAALDSHLALFASKFQKLTEVERSALFCALLFEELPVISTGTNQQPNWDWTSVQHNLDSVIDQAFEPLMNNIQVSETKKICKEIIRNKFLLRTLSKEMLPTSSNSLDEIEKQISDKKMASLLMLFSFAAFDYIKPENHPQARLSRQQWGRLVKLAEFLEKQIGEKSFQVSNASNHAENGSLEMDILQSAGLLLSSHFGTKLTKPLGKLREIVISAPKRSASSLLMSTISAPDAQNECSLRIEVYTLDRKDLLSDMLVLFSKKGLTVRGLEAITFSLEHETKHVAPVIDIIDLAVPKKLIQTLPDLIKELENELQKVISSESQSPDNLSTSTAIPEDDISAISLSLASDNNSLRLSVLTPKTNYSKALNRIAWVISKQFNGNILMFNQDNRWGKCQDCEIVFIFKLDQNNNIQDLEQQILRSIIEK